MQVAKATVVQVAKAAKHLKRKGQTTPDMVPDIFWFTRHGKYGFLSNFYRSPITVDGIAYSTVEHYYQSMKTRDATEQEMIRNTPTPKEAKFAGYHVSLRPDWEEVKEDFMLKALKAKFSQHPDLAQKLLRTGSALLHENSPWDKYWGYAGGKGKDRLGVLLMQVRQELASKRIDDA